MPAYRASRSPGANAFSGLYDQDFNAWIEQQADLLRAGRWAELDVQHLIDEIQSMDRSERKELVNRLVIRR